MQAAGAEMAMSMTTGKVMQRGQFPVLMILLITFLKLPASNQPDGLDFIEKHKAEFDY